MLFAYQLKLKMISEDRILINIIGTGYDLRHTRLDKALYNLLKQDTNTLQDDLFNLDFYNTHSELKGYKNWENFKSINSYRGANVLDKGQIEIWINRKKRKFNINELYQSNSLFDMFNTEIKQLSLARQQLLIGVQEKGYLGQYLFTTKHFELSKLQFHLLQIHTEHKQILVLNQIEYNNKIILNVRNNTAITGTFCQIN